MRLKKNNLLNRPIHIISANLHSVMNTLHAPKALKTANSKKDIFQTYEALSQSNSEVLRNKVTQEAAKSGMIYIKDTSGTNIDVQIFDTAKINFDDYAPTKPNKLGVTVLDNIDLNEVRKYIPGDRFYRK